MRKFAWCGRLSTKDKQDPTISFPSQRSECAEKAEELGGRIVCDFTDQEAGRRDDRVGWSELIREAKEPDARRFDAVIVYSTSRLSRELFHALAFQGSAVALLDRRQVDRVSLQQHRGHMGLLGDQHRRPGMPGSELDQPAQG